jgi:hypothetical protein
MLDRAARTGLNDPTFEVKARMQPEGDDIDRAEENERLLSETDVKPLSTSKQGWVSILGFSVGLITFPSYTTYYYSADYSSQEVSSSSS